MIVKYHSWAKHVFQCSYLQACEKIYKNKKVNFYYYDLFSGDGLCECKLPTGDIETWDGSAKSAIIYCNNMGESFKGATFNDYEKSEELKENIFPLIKNNNLVKFYNKKADEVIDEILLETPVDKQTFFFLDPTKYIHLSWGTIEKIGKHCCKSYYHGYFMRRPEIMVNLMVFGMNRNYKKAEESITRALGTNEWIEERKKCVKDGEDPNVAFERIFRKQLKKLFHDPFRDEQPEVFSFEVRGTKNQVIYYMFFISSHPLANTIFKKLKPYMENYKNERMNEHVVWRARAAGFKPLTDFC